MKAHRSWAALILGLAWVAGSGCTTLREVPRSEYAAKPDRKHVKVTTLEGLSYEFDAAHVSGDTLVGSSERETEGSVRDVAEVAVPLSDIVTLSVRGIDWFRTGLVGGAAIAGVIAATTAQGNQTSSGTPSPGGKPLPE